MMIDEYHERQKGEALGEDKEIKVKIPLDYHIKLHTVKVVKGQNISDTVKIALERYFEGLRAEQVTAEPATPFARPFVRATE
jgi:FKBP-type peptidyl-prolyl cis-trans isomerase (trigger factor)